MGEFLYLHTLNTDSLTYPQSLDNLNNMWDVIEFAVLRGLESASTFSLLATLLKTRLLTAH